ncbi:sensor histidine kinase [Oceanirhabdus sp. W0125-5]|uniref:sensor histidine kinase n=1 Tax=Oceanirhabdus sp. W0125-5 TaxID=2999116 RepID=UPI0022F2B887|nr:sensor histidine kinase [Oceanirhabdus sp. W0125-5]WBW98588.1 GHKL domain-containing protein [Oceanirhabdus sp. W0125-5]
MEILIMLVYLIFYNNDIFLQQIKWFIPILTFYIIGRSFGESGVWLTLFVLICLWTTFTYKNKLNKYTGLTLFLVSAAALSISLRDNLAVFVVIIVLAFDQYALLSDSESVKSIDAMQKKFLSHQYEEIKNVYLNMRGWRHDYHNHIQAMKAYLAMGEVEELEEYISKLEKELESVDSLVKSGNIMMDAILNSKISIMMNHGIKVDFKAVLPEELKIKDIDMCVMVSNLLENAMESCMKIPVEKRFIRIYSEVFGSQFYMSIQNSAEEELDFNQRNYISTKRGEHGLGMKRVQFLVNKYEGFLNLQNEPGIFASEITIPL